MSNIPLEQDDFERQVEFDFLRATESAALKTLQWLGKGQKEKADEAACDAIRGTLDVVNICGEVVIGEGIKDNAPSIFKRGKDRQLERWIAAIRDKRLSGR
jgi:fructose-1,6-bisphosphatase II